jgi:hypothetical protein
MTRQTTPAPFTESDIRRLAQAANRMASARIVKDTKSARDNVNANIQGAVLGPASGKNRDKGEPQFGAAKGRVAESVNRAYEKNKGTIEKHVVDAGAKVVEDKERGVHVAVTPEGDRHAREHGFKSMEHAVKATGKQDGGGNMAAKRQKWARQSKKRS